MVWNPNFKPAGVSEAGEKPPLEIRPVHAHRLQSIPFHQLTMELTFFVPYLPMTVDFAVDPVVQVIAEKRLGPVFWYWDLPVPVFRNLRYLREAGMSTHRVFGVPNEWWPEIERSIGSTLSIDSHRKTSVRLDLARVRFFDYNAQLTRHIDDINKISFPLHVIEVVYADAALRAANAKPGQIPVRQLLGDLDNRHGVPGLRSFAARILDKDEGLIDDISEDPRAAIQQITDHGEWRNPA